MKTRLLIACAAAFGCASLLIAQSGVSISADAKRSYEGVKRNILNAVNKMPEDAFSYKATPDVRSYAQVVNHITEAQMHGCAAVLGKSPQAAGEPKSSKADVVTALKQSFDECDQAFDALTDSNATEAVSSPRGQRSKLGILIGVIGHDDEQWGILSVYMRLKGIKPTGAE